MSSGLCTLHMMILIGMKHVRAGLMCLPDDVAAYVEELPSAVNTAVTQCCAPDQHIMLLMENCSCYSPLVPLDLCRSKCLQPAECYTRLCGWSVNTYIQPRTLGSRAPGRFLQKWRIVHSRCLCKCDCSCLRALDFGVLLKLLCYIAPELPHTNQFI